MSDTDQKTVELDEGVTVSSPDTTEQDVTPAADDGPSSMMEAVEAAIEGEGASSDTGTENVEGEDGGSAAPEPEAGTDGKQADAAGDPSGQSADQLPEGDPTEDELKDYSQKANARIRDLVAQRNEAQGRAERVTPILDFLEKNDIPQQDLDVILDMSARLRHGDFAGFLQAVTPYVNLAQQYTGQVLPPDLQQQVQQGYVSPEIAKELAQSRAQMQVQQGQSRIAQERSNRQMVDMQAGNIRTAIGNWEKQIQQSDPDYALKADMIRRTSQALMQEHGAPRTPQDAVKMVQAAYDEVNGQAQRLRPQPKPTRQAPRSTGQSGGTTPTVEPKSMMDAAMAALEQHRA